MHRVLDHVRDQAASLASHRLFEWLADDTVEPRARLLFLPMAIDFVMGFRDLNNYFIVYPEPSSELERALNVHAAEDATHSRMFLADWDALAIDELLQWAPRDLYWWMTCDRTEPARRLDFELSSMVFHAKDPLMRFPIIESMEAAGNVFFQRTVPIVRRLAETTGKDYPYFGEYHLHRESGHLQNTDERSFAEAELPAAQCSEACSTVSRVFEIFDAHFEMWRVQAKAIHEAGWDYRPRAVATANVDLRPEPARNLSRYMSLDYPPESTGRGADLVEMRRAAFDELWDSPFYTWIREEWPDQFGRKVRYFLLQWVVDNWACSDYFVFDTTYRAPDSPAERGINRLSILYASEMKRRYVEWETLQFDDYTNWTTLQALEHYWLDEQVERHREIFADLRKLTLQYPDPLYRYWIMKCFVRFGDALMHSLGVAMQTAGVPDEHFITFAGSPERLHPDLPHDPEADRAIAAFERAAIGPTEEAIIRDIITRTAAQEMERSSASWTIVCEERYRELDRRWEEAHATPTVTDDV